MSSIRKAWGRLGWLGCALFILLSGCVWNPETDPWPSEYAHRKALRKPITADPVQSVAPAPVDNHPWKPPAADRDWKMIVIHHAAFEEGNAESIDDLHRKRGMDELGYHFVIGNGSMSHDGMVEVGARWTAQKHGAHVRISPHDDNLVNRVSIGICLVGNLEEHAPSQAQITSLIQLVRYLQQRYHIPAANIRRHSDFKNTACPGQFFPWDEFLRSL